MLKCLPLVSFFFNSRLVVEKKHSFLGTITIFEGACSFSCANVTCTSTKHSTGYFVDSKLKKPNEYIQEFGQLRIRNASWRVDSKAQGCSGYHRFSIVCVRQDRVRPKRHLNTKLSPLTQTFSLWSMFESSFFVVPSRPSKIMLYSVQPIALNVVVRPKTNHFSSKHRQIPVSKGNTGLNDIPHRSQTHKPVRSCCVRNKWQ